MGKENFKILIVDDEPSFSLLVSRILKDEGYRVKAMSNPVEALKAADDFEPDLIISDLRMPVMDGISFMNEVKTKNLNIDFIMITAHATVETAVNAMKMGALDYITKPLKEPEELRQLALKAYEKHRLVFENRALREELQGDTPPVEIIFAGIEDIAGDAEAVAKTDSTVILYGETGTGKSLIAKVIHQMSGRKGLFVTVNCASIPENLLESEFFGYEKGAFTGAVKSKKGKFDLANDGTIFLDEIAEMSPNLQAKLLRVLQEKSFERLGGVDTIKTNARVITATNRDLKMMVSDKNFREDLYYRLNVFPIHIKPLRERKKFIPQLTEYLVKKLSLKIGKTIHEIPEESFERLVSYQWPGNIRELENTIERAMILSRQGMLSIQIPEPVHEDSRAGDMRSIEKKAIENALNMTNGNRKSAAEMLGISLRSLQYKIKEYGVKQQI
jgi:DNA-binding NtrC family response regulator